jgi:hypothetical protein
MDRTIEQILSQKHLQRLKFGRQQTKEFAVFSYNKLQYVMIEIKDYSKLKVALTSALIEICPKLTGPS